MNDMLQLRPSCECCDAELPPDSSTARICSFECTFCADCTDLRLGGHCPNCGGELKIIAAILEAPVVEKILMHLGLQARAPPRAPARGQTLQAA